MSALYLGVSESRVCLWVHRGNCEQSILLHAVPDRPPAQPIVHRKSHTRTHSPSLTPARTHTWALSRMASLIRDVI